MLISAGAVTPLVLLLQSECPMLQDAAARLLLGLTRVNDAQARAIVSAGGIPTLVHLLRSDVTAAQILALTVLTTLAAEGGSPGDVNAMKRAGALPLLTKLMGDADVGAGTRNAAASLLHLLQQSSSHPPSSLQRDHPSSNEAPPPPSTSAHSSESHPVSTPGDPIAAAAAADSFGHYALHTSPATGGARHQSVGSRVKKSCWSCGATGVPLQKCSVCAVAAYCGAGCQKADWKAHKGQCAGLKAGASGSGSSAAVGDK